MSHDTKYYEICVQFHTGHDLHYCNIAATALLIILCYSWRRGVPIYNRR